jgi:hypothetical protein
LTFHEHAGGIEIYWRGVVCRDGPAHATTTNGR